MRKLRITPLNLLLNRQKDKEIIQPQIDKNTEEIKVINNGEDKEVVESEPSTPKRNEENMRILRQRIEETPIRRSGPWIPDYAYIGDDELFY